MKPWILIAFLPSLSFSYATISPSTATVKVANSVTITSTDTITCSLVAGSTGTLSGCTYTAPVSFQAKNVVDGCPAFPNDHVFNTRIDALPVHSSSTARVNNMVASHIAFEVSFPHNILNNNTPTTSMVFRFTANNNGAFPVLPFPYRGEEASIKSNAPLVQDHHILGVSTNTCTFYEMYQYYNVGDDPGALTTNSQSGYSYGDQYALPDVSGGGGGATDAAGMAILPLSLRYSELKAGQINHALRFTLNNGNIYSGFLWPAVANTNQCGNNATCVPYGSRFRLKSSYTIPATDSVAAKAIKTALKNYGMILADGGTAMRIQTMADVTLDSATWNVIWNEIPVVSSMSQTDFEQVDSSSMMVSTSSGKVALTKGFVTPDNYAEVLVTKTADSSTTSLRIAIQPVTVGTYNLPFLANGGSLSVMAGTPQFQIPYWVQGSTTLTVNCTMSPTLGTLTSGCLYTAPSSQVSFASSTVTITPTIDSTQPVSFPISVFPSDGIRLREGPKSSANAPVPTYDTFGSFTDSTGSVWWDDPIGNLPNFYTRQDIYSPQASWGSSTDIALFYTNAYASGDKSYGMMVPNGNYNLRLGFGIDNSPSDVSNSTASIDSQGIVLVSTVTLVDATYTPKILTYPVTITNNQFYWSLRGTSETSHTFLNNWSLIFVSSLPSPLNVLTGKATISGKGTFQ